MTKQFLVVFLGILISLVAGAQTTTNVIDAFNPSGIGTNSYANGRITNVWNNWFGGAFSNLTWDATSDANTNSNSGSLKIVANFPVNTDQFEVWDGLAGVNPTVNAIQFTNFQCDVRFAAGSATNTSGTFGSLQFGIPTPSYGQDYFNDSIAIAASNTNWVHVSIPLSGIADTNLTAISGLLIHIWGAGLTGPSTLWVDNIAFVGMATNTGTVTINYTNTEQRIDGFGASSAWMSTALSAADADLLFSTNTGAGLSLLRTRIAPGGTVDDAEGTIAQEALARGARIWSTPWSPAANFKITNSWINAVVNPTGNDLNGGWISNSVANFQAYASQLATYVVNMQNTYGIKLYALSMQNEPDEDVDYESCQWTSQNIHDFLPYLSAALTASNVASTKILLPENSNWSWNLATNAMNDTMTSNMVGILACHNYGSTAAAVTQFGTPCPTPLWETEHYLGTDDSITNGLELAQEIHSFINVAQANTYHYWWLTGSGTGSIADNTSQPAKRLFVMGNYSRFVRPNFYRIDATNNSLALVSAYKATNSANFVIVAANPNSCTVNQTIVLTNFPISGTLTQWVTSGSLSLSNQGPVTPTGNTFTYVLPPWTVVSLVYTPATPPNITQQPTNQLGVVGGSVTFGVIASGASPLNYQWYFNGTNNLPGATNASLTLIGLALTSAGNYSVIVSNYLGSVTSGVASLSVATAITWTTPNTISGAADVATNGISLYAYNNSGSQAVVNGLTFMDVNSDTAWGTNISLSSGWTATTTTSYTGGSAAPWSNLPLSYQTLLQGGVWNNGGAATVALNNLIIGHEYAVQVWVNDSRSGSTTNRTETLTSLGGNMVTLAYNTTYAVGGVGQYAIGTFMATATNQTFTMNSSTSTQLNALQVLDVTPTAPTIIQQPSNQAAWTNGSSTFAVTATGTVPLSYQWVFNGTNYIPGGTNANLTLIGLTMTNAGTYSVLVANIAGSITSSVVRLTVSADANFVLAASDASGSSSFNSIGNWTNSLTGVAAAFAPTSGYTYRTGPSTLRTPSTPGNYSFAGNSLFVSSGGNLNIKGGSGNIITFTNLILSGQINNSINPNQIAVLAGNLTVENGACLNTQSTNNDTRIITNTMNMSGDGGLTNTSLGFGSPGIVVFTGINTPFTGPLIVNGNTILQVASLLNLGGNPASFNAGQLILDNGTFQPSESMALSNPHSGVTLGTGGGTFNLGVGITCTNLNPIAGIGNLSCLGGGTLLLGGTNHAMGGIMASNSTLSLQGKASFQNSWLGISNSATLDLTKLNIPLSISNVIALGGNLIVNVNTDGTGSTLAAQNMIYGGTLIISNIGPALTAGTTFQLFSASNYSGSFNHIIPDSPGWNLLWDTNALTINGSLSIIATNATVPQITSFALCGTNLIFAGTNGGAYGSIFYTLASTNLSMPRTGWTVLATNLFGPGGAFYCTNSWINNNGQSYFLLRQ